ncbi:MAG: hotdog domain-containing protein [Candidatus Thalassarchaeum sp.]|jgi:acyl-CoA hydrolase|nr:hotdog domain-containing protein [Candidatus Thalassarchaeum sp.]
MRKMSEPHSLEPVVLLNEVFPGHTNSMDTLYGGRLMSIMDTAAGMVSSKFAHSEFVTVSVDSLKFRRPAYQGDIIRTTSKVVWTSPHTTGVHVVSCRLSRSAWEGEEICSGFFFMVAVDSDMQPTSVPQFSPVTNEEKELWNRAQAARDAMG